MSKIMSYSIIHYGQDFLPFALKSVEQLVEKSYCFYTPHPSHGHSSTLTNPETRDQIMSSIPVDQWDKIVWIDTDNFWDEGHQRNYAVQTLINAGADLIVNLDYDEIHSPENLDLMLKEIWDRNIARNNLVNMLHFWRSFNWVCEDDGWPVRIIDTRQRSGTNYLSPAEFGKVNHFGYAITSELLRYKMSLHGHKDEWRKDWYEKYWTPWPPVNNVHPTNDLKENGEGWWDPKPYDKSLLPEFMRNHKWYNEDLIP